MNKQTFTLVGPVGFLQRRHSPQSTPVKEKGHTPDMSFLNVDRHDVNAPSGAASTLSTRHQARGSSGLTAQGRWSGRQCFTLGENPNMGVCATESSCSASEHLLGSQRVTSVIHVAASFDVKLSASRPVPSGANLGPRVRFKLRSRYPLSDIVHVRSWRHTSGCRFRVKGHVCGKLSPSRNLGSVFNGTAGV
jgi:hypothetical protein